MMHKHRCCWPHASISVRSTATCRLYCNVQTTLATYVRAVGCKISLRSLGSRVAYSTNGWYMQALVSSPYAWRPNGVDYYRGNIIPRLSRVSLSLLCIYRLPLPRPSRTPLIIQNVPPPLVQDEVGGVVRSTIVDAEIIGGMGCPTLHPRHRAAAAAASRAAD